jgi:hypothetical protein
MNPADLDALLRALFLFVGIVLGGGIAVGLIALVIEHLRS